MTIIRSKELCLVFSCRCQVNNNSESVGLTMSVTNIFDGSIIEFREFDNTRLFGFFKVNYNAVRFVQFKAGMPCFAFEIKN